MLRIALIHGAIAGVIVIAVMCAGIFLSGGEGGGSSQVFGYLVMLVALSLIFVGVKRHRDVNLGGVIRFLPAFGVGLLISAVAGVFYVVGWEIYLAATDYAFAADYFTKAIDAKRAAGVPADELAKFEASMREMQQNYANPFFRLPITFTEIFPVGVVVSLVSAAVLRNPKALPARAT